MTQKVVTAPVKNRTNSGAEKATTTGKQGASGEASNALTEAGIDYALKSINPLTSHQDMDDSVDQLKRAAAAEFQSE